MKIAVAILNWNGVQLLKQFLPSVIQFSQKASIYLIDNASTDDSVTFVMDNYPSVKIIKNNSNFGYSKGYNEALKQVEEKYYALINSDVEVSKNWLEPIQNIFENEPETAIIQPKILDYKNKKYFEYAGAAGGFIDKYGFPYCRGRIFQSIEEDLGQYDDTCEIFWASGACFFIRKEVFRKLNGFDNDFFAHQEEIDLCWRAFNLNYKIKYTPLSTVYHVGGATLKEGSTKKTFLNFRNSLFMLLKNLPKSQLLPTLFIRLIMDGIAGIFFLSKGKIGHLIAVLKSHISFYYYLFKFLKKREDFHYKKYYKIKSILMFALQTRKKF